MNTAIQFFGSTGKHLKNPFISVWKTDNVSTGSSLSNQISIPFQPPGRPTRCHVDWGDGSTSYITSFNQAEKTHTYSSAGVYTIEIKGTANIAFGADGENKKILDIIQWGDSGVRPGSGGNTGPVVFTNCSNLNISATDIPDLTEMRFERAFDSCTSLVGNLTWRDWDINQSSDTNMTRMFIYSSFNLDVLRFWDFSQKTNLTRFLQSSAYSHPLTGLDLTSCSNLSYMFFNNVDYNHPINSWQLRPDGVDCSDMLRGATGFKQDFVGFEVEKVTNLSNFLLSAGISTTDYDATLNDWSAKTLRSDLSFHAGNSKYSPSAATDRASIISNYNWTITDGGPA